MFFSFKQHLLKKKIFISTISSSTPRTCPWPSCLQAPSSPSRPLPAWPFSSRTTPPSSHAPRRSTAFSASKDSGERGEETFGQISGSMDEAADVGGILDDGAGERKGLKKVVVGAIVYWTILKYKSLVFAT